MTIKLKLPQGNFSFLCKRPNNSLLFENDATGLAIMLSEPELLELLSSGVAKLIKPVTDRWDYWGCPEILITDDGSGWGA
jgi:hypothetical protein